MPITITKQNYDQEVTNSSLPVIIDIYAEWCGPCQQMAPIVDQIEKELAGTHKFVKLNVDESKELAIQFGVSSIPTFVFIKNNQVKGKTMGYKSKDALIAEIKKALS